MENPIVDRKALAAALLGCQPEELLGFRDEGLSGVVLIAPDGRKLRYPEELLRRAQAWLVDLPEPEEAAGHDDAIPAGWNPALQEPVGRLSQAAVGAENGGTESRQITGIPVGRVSQPAVGAENGESGGMASFACPESRPTKKARRPKGKRP
ncbi:MAG TPA: hypothetical protein VI776_04670 [Anaerolineales bacterium]|nr:hypothetical protein [Anaerolineales bacterium]